MLVKILSMHRVVNYGSFMQAYALKRVVESMGAQCSFADFAPGTPRHKGAKVQVDGPFKKALKLPRFLLNISSQLEKRRFHAKMQAVFTREVWPLLGMTEQQDFDYSSDLFIVGSDEVFNYTQNHIFGYVPALFGHGVTARRLISYAASAGYASLTDVKNDGMTEELRSGLAKFDNISVRDQNTKDMVAGVLGTQPTMVVDPTLLYDFSKEIPKLAPRAEKYLLVYAYEGRMESPEEVDRIKAFARARNLKIVSPGFYHAWCDENVVVSPFELLAYFQNAEYVVTDTFHGSIFAIKARKRFVTLVREKSKWGGNASKVSFLLEQLKLSHRVIGDMNELPSMMDKDVDYSVTDEALAYWRGQSLGFLSSEVDAAKRGAP